MSKMATAKNRVIAFVTVAAASAVSNLIDVLELNLSSNSRKFSKVGGRTVSARQVFDQFVNRQRKLENDKLEAKGQDKISQYDAVRRIASSEITVEPRDFYQFGDRLCDVLGIQARPNDDEIHAAIGILAEDWANDPSNVYTSFAELRELAPETSAEMTESAIPETV